jgi:subtilisin family serine protease
MRHRSVWITPEEGENAIRTGRGRGIKIAIIDSGVELSHPSLRHVRLLDDVAFEKTASGIVERAVGAGVDKYGHGTAIAFVINRIAPEAQLGSFRVLDENNGTKYIILDEAVRVAIDRGYHIINCSFGSDATLEAIKYFKPWIDLSYRHGIHVVAACNNFDFRSAEWPGYFPTAIVVNMAKTESDDVFFRWDVPPQGDFGQHLVEFAARGVDVELPWNHGQTVTRTGSSFAAPHVAALLARLLSIYPSLKPPVAKALLQEIALPWQPDYGGPNG